MQPNYYAVIPAHVRYDKGLPPAARLLYGEVTALANKEGYCFAGNAYFAELYDVDKLTISRWLSKLKEKGYIDIVPNTATSDRRIYLLPDPLTKKSVGVDEIINPPIQKDQPPYAKRSRGVDEKINHNTTVNTTPNTTVNKESDGSVEPSTPAAQIKEKKAVKAAYREKVTLTETEYDTLFARHGQALTDRLLDKLSLHKLANGTTYKSDYHAILKWVVDAVAEDDRRGRRAGSVRPPVVVPPKDAVTYADLIDPLRAEALQNGTIASMHQQNRAERESRPIPF